MSVSIKTLVATGLVAASLTAGCSSRQQATSLQAAPTVAAKPLGGVKALPKAFIYKMNGPWADRVAINVNPATGTVVSYPAPTDLTPATEPLPLADGWWLDRRGLSLDSRFTTWTWQAYRALPAAPSAAELLAAVEPQARVAEMVEMPMLLNQAVADTASVNTLIREGLPGCNPYPSR